jgi:hypothetical protein
MEIISLFFALISLIFAFIMFCSVISLLWSLSELASAARKYISKITPLK